ncbi:uncharacterized protein Z518_07214 [Rhinocladiella mackenziei CBS 650.93]|uniref:Uncharacterized protein n=1 Tax=Rhinocladiella mackenziei CBS 650.93 TaxID=1442369 RepID=A0A0D2IK96_9EURO|nr:uncharacterized protein Z518_07214 [Rhinocladiella mackenziei CBS 650.93]KIX03661.1 hypothetical protein Z518_07214 [Rhinocladiella mackenziei CBS 650.93]
MKAHTPPDALFLAPPHSHDPSDVSHVAALPSSMLLQLPESVQNALWTLQESTSIVYASYIRLQALLNERFDRLIPLPVRPGAASTGFSEGAFFNYVNHLAAERRYLLEDAHPDWKHKASRAGLNNYGELLLTFRGKEMTVAEWFSQLQAAEAFWIHEAKQTELPDFESTVLEYQSQSSTPSSEVGEDDEAEAEDAIGPQPVAAGGRVVGARKQVNSDGLGLKIAKALEAL